MFLQMKKEPSMTRIQYSGYDIVARARGQEPLFFRQYGSYQGEWLLVSRDSENYFIYKDGFGSCSGCDSLEAAHGYGDNDAFGSDGFIPGDKSVLEFIEAYKPFITIPKAKMYELIKNPAEFKAVFPANIDYDFTITDLDTAVLQVSLLVKSELGIITPQELLQIDNSERKREAIEKYGEEKLMDDLNGEVLDTEGDNKLVKVPQQTGEDFVFVNVKDSSTPRRYLLRVPPTTKTVKEGIAWTFNMKTEEYNPTQET